MAELIDINLDDVEPWGEPVPGAIYKVKVASAEWKQKEGGEYPYISVTLQPTQEPYTSRKLFLNLSTNPKAVGNIKAFFNATRMGLSKIRPRDPEIVQMLTGRECNVTVGIEEDTQYGKRNVVTPPYHVA